MQCFPARSANLIITAQVTPVRRVVHRSYVQAMMGRALAAGGVRRSLTHVHWDVSGKCETPHLMEIEGRLDKPRRDPWGHTNIVHQGVLTHFDDCLPQQAPLLLVMETRCRKCPPCLRLRGWEWRTRMCAEILAAPRTWFGTLTLRPEEHIRAEYRAHARLSSGGTDFAKLDPGSQFREVHAEISRDLTLWLKRIRKESGATLRYCLVAEAHKSGDPHYHVLVHETVGGGSVKERQLRQQWTLGHSKFNLVTDKKAAAYVAKYLSKSSLARVRASIDYGNTSRDIASERAA